MALIRGGREEPAPLEPQISGIAGRANDIPAPGLTAALTPSTVHRP